MKINELVRKTVFIPAACLLGALGVVAWFSNQLALYSKTLLAVEAIQAGVSPLQAGTVSGLYKLVGYLFLGVCVFAFRNVNFRTIFRAWLSMIALVLIASVFFFEKSILFSYIIENLCVAVVYFLGWGYVNQISNVSDGKKYYFVLSFVAIAMISLVGNVWAFVMVPQTFSPTYGTTLLTGALIFIGVSFVCARVLESRANESGQEEDSLDFSMRLVPSVICLAVLLAGMKLISILEIPLFKASAKAVIQPYWYSNFMFWRSVGSEIALLGLCLFSAIFGPRLLRTLGWKAAIWMVSAVSFIAVLLVVCCGHPIVYAANLALFKGFEASLICPLIQIALLSVCRKDRFLVQGLVFLVAGPLLGIVFGLIEVGEVGAHIASVAVLGLMAFAATMMVRKNEVSSGNEA